MAHLDSDADFTVAPIPEETQQAARRTVAQTAIRLGATAEDTHRVLDLLGLLPAETEERKPGTCPGCGGELPIQAHSPKAGLGGFCTRSCRDKNKKPAVQQTVSATRARERLLELKKVTTFKAVAAASGVSIATISGVANGVTPTIRPETEQAILAVTGMGKAGAA